MRLLQNASVVSRKGSLAINAQRYESIRIQTDNELTLIMYITNRLIAISVSTPGRFNDSSETRGKQRLVIQARRNGLDSLRTCFLSCIAVKVATRAENSARAFRSARKTRTFSYGNVMHL